jgi:tRNA A37 threonylcarbamoyladenosine dehydratase
MHRVERIIVFGVGAAGANFVLNQVCVHPQMGCTLVDFDRVERRNVSAVIQPYAASDIRRPKVQALQRMLQTQFNKRGTSVSSA